MVLLPPRRGVRDLKGLLQIPAPVSGSTPSHPRHLLPGNGIDPGGSSGRYLGRFTYFTLAMAVLTRILTVLSRLGSKP